MVSQHTILVVDDEAPIRKLILSAFGKDEYKVIEAASGAEGLRMVATCNPELVVLDLGLPDMDGSEVIRRLREFSAVPIIVLSARGEESAKVQALDSGANDYVTKPFGMSEFLARVRVLLRLPRTSSTDMPKFESGGIEVEPVSREVKKNGVLVHLTPLEYKLLLLLIQYAGRVLTHRQLLTEVWGAAYAGQNHYLRIFMKSLRHKLEDDPTRPKMLITESGIGYRLVPLIHE